LVGRAFSVAAYGIKGFLSGVSSKWVMGSKYVNIKWSNKQQRNNATIYSVIKNLMVMMVMVSR
jgi:N-acetyl-gamma-glutamylphosphate reductase